MIHISYSACGFTHNNERVRVNHVSTSSYKKFELVGMYGVIKKYASGKYGVLLDGIKNPASREGLFWIESRNLKLESEDNRMAKLTGFNKVAVIEQGTGYSQKDYFYALYDDNIHPGNKVLVSGSASGQIWTVKDIVYEDTYANKNITAEVICKVDTTDYDNRCKNRKEAEELRKQMHKKRKEIEARKDDEYYASLDSEYAEMLAKYKGL